VPATSFNESLKKLNILENIIIMSFDLETVNLIIQKFIQVFKYGAIVGFFVTTILIINLNNKAFNSVFQQRSKSYFWFFLLISIIPLLAFIYVFNILFGKITLAFTRQ